MRHILLCFLITLCVFPLTGQDTVSETIIEIEDMQIPEEGTSEFVAVPFSIVEKTPVFPGCDEISETDLKKCFQKNVQQHVAKHLEYTKKDLKNDVQKKMRAVFFVAIDGKIVDPKFYGSDPQLEKEVLRVLALLPQMKPGKQRGKVVRVAFSLPIILN